MVCSYTFGRLVCTLKIFQSFTKRRVQRSRSLRTESSNTAVGNFQTDPKYPFNSLIQFIYIYNLSTMVINNN